MPWWVWLAASALLVRLLIGRRTWFTYTLAACAFAVFEPVRDTFSFGQVNLVLLAPAREVRFEY